MCPNFDDDSRPVGDSEPADPVAPIRKWLRLEGFVGVSAAIAAVLREVELVAPQDGTPLLITGGPGTGKTRLARLIHENSPRRGQPLVELHCASIPECLVESELFGALENAGSGAPGPIEGTVAAAQGGTLLVAEVGDLPMGAQAKLLLLLNRNEYTPLGSSVSSTADVRVIAETNDDLARAVHEGRFRADLLHRLQPLTLRMPSLPERREDILPLAGHFCECARRSHGLAQIELSHDALIAIEEATGWGGNVRELACLMEAAMIRAAGANATVIEAAHVFPGPWRRRR